MEKKLLTLNSELITIISVLILCFSCKAQKGTEENKAAKNLVPTLIVCDDYGGSEVHRIEVIKDEKSLKTAFANINKARKPGLSVPILDFNKKIAILVSRGQAKGSSQIGLKIISVTSDRIILEVDNTQKAKGTAITVPFCLYTIPYTQKDLVFKESTE